MFSPKKFFELLLKLFLKEREREALLSSHYVTTFSPFSEEEGLSKLWPIL
jgi:hypothetical protein